MASCGGRIVTPPIASSTLPLARRRVLRLSIYPGTQKSLTEVLDERRLIESLAETMHGRDHGGETQLPTGRSPTDQATSLLSRVIALGVATLVAAASFNEAAAAASVETGLAFQRSCAGCHSGGGNILQPAATLFAKDLEKNGLGTVEDIYNITYFGKNRMPGYGQKCTPRGQCTFGPRLSEEEVRDLAEFVKQQADEDGWAKVPT